jgi:hypothetical protein
MPSNNSMEKMEGFDFAKQERELFAGEENNATMVMQLVTRRLMENAE